MAGPVIPLSKCAKYLARLETWSENGIVTRAEWNPLLAVSNITALSSVKVAPSCPLSIAFKLNSSHHLRLYSNTASHPKFNRMSSGGTPSRTRVLRPVSPPLPLQVFVDASSFGIGFLSGGCWLGWRLLPGWNSDGRDIGWAEMVAVDLGLRALIHSGLRDVHIHIWSDNQGVVGAIRAGRSRSLAQNDILCRLSTFTCDHGILFSVEWVRSADNLSDGISRGVFPHFKSRFSRHPPLPDYLEPFVKPV